MKFFIGIIVLIAFNVVSVRAQTKQLTVGDTLPNINLNNIINYERGSFNTQDAKGKILIIDFWSTWCSSCIEAFPKLDRLQKRFKDDVLILPVTRQKRKAITDFWSQNAFTKHIDLPTVTGDSVLSGYFPHQGVPHVVWIGPNGEVMSFTDGQYVDSTIISKVINGEKVNWPVMVNNEDLFDFDKPLIPQYFNWLEGDVQPSVYYRSLTSHIDGLKARIILDTTDNGGSKRIVFVNNTILSLYRYAIREIYGRDVEANNRVILEIKDTGHLIYDDRKHYQAGWRRENTYCYEAIWPEHTSMRQVMNGLMEDMSVKFNLVARLESRKMPCLALVKLSDEPFPKRQKLDPLPGQATYKYTADIVDALNRLSPAVPVVDESGIAEMVNIPLGGESGFWRDIEKVNRQLEAFKLQIIKVERNVEVLVLRSLDTQ